MGVFQCDVFQNNVFQGPCGVAEEVAPQVQQQPAGRVYAPIHRRGKRRIHFLEQELIEKQDRQQELERQAKDDRQPGPWLDESRAELKELQLLIPQLMAEIARLQAQDEDDAIAAVLMAATLH